MTDFGESTMNEENTEQFVSMAIEDGVATLTLRHPTRPNPLSRSLQEQLLAALRSLGNDMSVRALVLTGAGKAFCVGADLDEMRQAAAGGASLGEWTSQLMGELTNPIVLALRELHFPVVCAVNGPAAGAGAGLALAADVLLMGDSSFIYLPFVPRLGVVPDMGSTWFLPRAIGPQRAMAVTLLGDRVSARQAVQWGLAWDHVTDADLAGHAATLARRLAKLPPGAALEARRAFAAAEGNTLDQQLEYERQRQRVLIDGPSFAEGMRAFLARREPVFPARGDDQ